MTARILFTPPDDLDLATVHTTQAGRYRVELTPNEAGKPPIGPIHRWTIVVRTPDGRPVEKASITIDGGMPQHGHGFPTAPRVTREIGGGAYLVDGMKFSMTGWWTLTVKVDAEAGTDEATFNIVL